ncbi:MAG: DNA recombination protein RmuC [Thermodesulfobacterium sp.]|nr:DNA recombination protein RmuC [Thermodesulfobacterium sp.]
MITYFLLGIVIILLGIVIFLLLKREKIEKEDIENVILKIWNESGLNERIGELGLHAKEIKEAHKSIERMLRVPFERGSFGEIVLETILSDQLPPDMFGIRKKVLDGKIPDAYIKSTVGIICIDSKFPLENYRKMIESEDPKEKEIYKNNFLRDVKFHLEKIANDYVCPEKGSAGFAFAYIPSESVYWFLVNSAFEMLRDYVKKGVQVVSPLTLSHKIELIKAGVHAKKLSEEAERVNNAILELSREFEKIDKVWKTFYGTHLKNLVGKAEELDGAYKRLKEEFDKISKLSN